MGDARAIELDAYKAVMRALYANPAYNNDAGRGIKRDLLLSQLRAELKIGDDENMEILSSIFDDTEVMQLAKGKHVNAGLKKKPAPLPGTAPAAPERERMPAAPRAAPRERDRNRAAHVTPPGGGGPSRQPRKSEPEKDQEKEDAKRDAFFGRKVKRFFDGKWLDCVVVHYRPGQGHCIASNHRKPGETWEWVNLHGDYDKSVLQVLDEVGKDVLVGDPNERNPKSRTLTFRGNQAAAGADNFNARLREAAKSEQATELMLAEVRNAESHLRAMLAVNRLLEQCASREDAERVVTERLGEANRRAEELRAEIERYRMQEEASTLGLAGGGPAAAAPPPSGATPVDPRPSPAARTPPPAAPVAPPPPPAAPAPMANGAHAPGEVLLHAEPGADAGAMDVEEGPGAATQGAPAPVAEAVPAPAPQEAPVAPVADEGAMVVDGAGPGPVEEQAGADPDTAME